jgi:hypothetical protein
MGLDGKQVAALIAQTRARENVSRARNGLLDAPGPGC